MQLFQLFPVPVKCNLNLLKQKQQAYLLNFGKTFNVNFGKIKGCFFSKKYKISRFLFLFILILLKHETLQLVQISIASNEGWKTSIFQRNVSFLRLILPIGDPPQWPLKVFKFIEWFSVGNDFQVEISWFPLICVKKISKICVGSSENCNFTIGFWMCYHFSGEIHVSG